MGRHHGGRVRGQLEEEGLAGDLRLLGVARSAHQVGCRVPDNTRVAELAEGRRTYRWTSKRVGCTRCRTEGHLLLARKVSSTLTQQGLSWTSKPARQPLSACAWAHGPCPAQTWALPCVGACAEQVVVVAARAGGCDCASSCALLLLPRRAWAVLRLRDGVLLEDDSDTCRGGSRFLRQGHDFTPNSRKVSGRQHKVHQVARRLPRLPARHRPSAVTRPIQQTASTTATGKALNTATGKAVYAPSPA